MQKLILAFASTVVATGLATARADDSGHISLNSLNAQLPRSYDALAPVSDDPGPSQPGCTYARGGLKYGCTWSPWSPSPN